MSLRVRAACKRRVRDLANHAFQDSPFVAQLTAFSDDPDHVLYFGPATGPKEPDSLDLTRGTDRFTIPGFIESLGFSADEQGAADAEASVEEAFNLFEQILMASNGMDHPDVPSEVDGDGVPLYRPAGKPHIVNVEGPGNWRDEKSGEANGWLSFDLQFFSNVRI